MEGRLLREAMSGGKPAALIDIIGVTHGTFYTARWIPRDVIDVGPPRKHTNDWTILVSGLGTQFRKPSTYLPSQPPDNSLLGKTVYAMVHAIYRERFQFIHPGLYSDIDRNGGPDRISEEIVRGVHSAGISHLLEKSSFTLEELGDAASYRLPTGKSQVLAGVYLRWSSTLR